MNKSTNILIILSVLLILIGCKFNNELQLELEKFDNSLDSLIKVKTYDFPKYCIFLKDTLHNNPIRIEEKFYNIYDDEPLKIDASSYVLNFKNKRLSSMSSENIYGHKYVFKYIYFKDKINNELIFFNKKRKTDTILVACIVKYDKQGRIVKKVEAYNMEQRNGYGLVKNSDYRILEVYKHNHKEGYYTTYRKEYFDKKYNIGSIRKIKMT